MTRNNYTEERKSRATQIGEQIKRMHEGDFIIWKANASNHGSYIINIEGGALKSYQSSHIGILEHVDLEKGIVTVIEGNANVPKVNEKNERMLVNSGRDGINGAQITGEYQEVNKRDGLLRKQYTIEELAAYGYSGYIDNSSRVK